MFLYTCINNFSMEFDAFCTYLFRQKTSLFDGGLGILRFIIDLIFIILNEIRNQQH